MGLYICQNLSKFTLNSNELIAFNFQLQNFFKTPKKLQNIF